MSTVGVTTVNGTFVYIFDWERWGITTGLIILLIYYGTLHAVMQVVGTLLYKPEGHGFYSDGVTGIFHWLHPSGRPMALG
jgi:hypothetical protein